MTPATVFDDHHVLRKDGIYAVPENMTWPECYIKTTTAKPREQYLMNKSEISNENRVNKFEQSL